MTNLIETQSHNFIVGFSEWIKFSE